MGANHLNVRSLTTTARSRPSFAIATLLCSCAGSGAEPSPTAGMAGNAAVAGMTGQAGSNTVVTGGSANAAAGSANAAGSGNGGGASAGTNNPTIGGSGGNQAGTSNMAGGGATGLAGTAGVGGAGFTPLFDGKSLDGFAAYREPSTALSLEQAAAIFKVEDGAIRVYGDAADKSTQARHTLLTLKTFSNYKLSFQYKWGTKTFAPYADVTRYPRDAGLLFHVHGDTHQVWPASIELQIKDGSTGDIFALYAQCTSLAKGGGTTFADAADGGTSKLVDGSTGFVQHARSTNFEVAGWNDILMEVQAGAATYWVNGHVVNRVLKVMDKTGKAITSGPLAFQAEHAEVFYRNISILELP